MASLEAAKTHGVARASWMQRQSDILGRWKPTFCVLYRNGAFAYYKDESRREEQGKLDIKTCYAVNAGVEIRMITPPQGKTIHCLLELRTPQINMTFCTDSVDDTQAWRASIIEVKNSLTQQPRPPAMAPSYGVAPSYAAAPSYGGPYMAPPPAYTVAQTAPPTQWVNPMGGTTTYATYQTPANQYVIPPANQTVVLAGHQAYPVQNTVYAYRGQGCGYRYTCVPSSSTTIVYRH